MPLAIFASSAVPRMLHISTIRHQGKKKIRKVQREYEWIRVSTSEFNGRVWVNPPNNPLWAHWPGPSVHNSWYVVQRNSEKKSNHSCESTVMFLIWERNNRRCVDLNMFPSAMLKKLMRTDLQALSSIAKVHYVTDNISKLKKNTNTVQCTPVWCKTL